MSAPVKRYVVAFPSDLRKLGGVKTLRSLIRDHQGFTTVRNPYVSDDHVREHFVDLPFVDFDPGLYQSSVASFSVLNSVLSELNRLNNGAPSPIIDIGVYAGRFSIAASLIARQNLMPVTLHAVEAVERLIDPIKENFELYNVEEVTLICAALSELDDQTLRLGIRKGGIIASTLVAPEEKAGADGEIALVRSVTLASLMRGMQNHALVKIDIEGNEAAAFRGTLPQKEILENNLFIIEWAPWQCDQKLTKTQTFGAFLIQHFVVYNLGNWACSHIESLITTLDDLRNCLQTNRSFNTDLLLIPKTMADEFEGSLQT